MELVFPILILAALGVLAARRFRGGSAASRREALLRSTPGMSAAHPLKIASFHDIDHAVDTVRCPCGGLLEKLGEGTRGALRFARCSCVICEEDLDLFFDLSELRH